MVDGAGNVLPASARLCAPLALAVISASKGGDA